MRGKPKNIKSPEKMWEHFQNYVQEAKSNPITVRDWVGGMAKEVVREKERPLTMEGFSIYCFAEGITKNIHDYFGNKNKAYADYSDICTRIKEVIREDQIAGGMAGIYNPSITQRLNGLKENVETNNSHKVESLTIEVIHTGVNPSSNEKDIQL
jgi:hypothetical protein